MLTPPHIIFRGFPRSAEIEALILQRIWWLEKFYPGIGSCRVSLDVPHRHRRDGSHVHVTIELTIPNGGAIVVVHDPSVPSSSKYAAALEQVHAFGTDSLHRYARTSVHDAFHTARRRLQDFARRQRGDVKTHP